MDTDSTVRSAASFLSSLNLCVGLGLSGLMIAACVLYLRKYKNAAGGLMLAGQLIAFTGWVVPFLFVWWGMEAFKERHSYTALGWVTACFSYVRSAGIILFVAGFWGLIASLMPRPADIRSLRWWQLMLAAFFLVVCAPVVMAAASTMYVRKYKNAAGYLLLAGSLVSVLGAVASLGMIHLLPLEWLRSSMALIGFAGIVGRALFVYGFWLVIGSLTIRDAAHEA